MSVAMSDGHPRQDERVLLARPFEGARRLTAGPGDEQIGCDVVELDQACVGDRLPIPDRLRCVLGKTIDFVTGHPNSAPTWPSRPNTSSRSTALPGAYRAYCRAYSHLVSWQVLGSCQISWLIQRRR